MHRNIREILVICCVIAASPLRAQDYGFPALNTAGRYFGMGWSHHTYHSNVNGRLNVLDRRHPASDYPSRSLSYPYLAEYLNYPVRSPMNNSIAAYWTQPEIRGSFPEGQHPTLAPDPAENGIKKSLIESQAEEVPSRPGENGSPQPRSTRSGPPKSTEPPPVWLKPYLDPNLDLPSNNPEVDDSELIELQTSPSDSTAPRSAGGESVITNRYRLH